MLLSGQLRYHLAAIVLGNVFVGATDLSHPEPNIAAPSGSSNNDSDKQSRQHMHRLSLPIPIHKGLVLLKRPWGLTMSC